MPFRSPRSLFSLILIVIHSACNSLLQGQVSNALHLSTDSVSESIAIARKTYGINFSPYLNGQDPNLGTQVGTSQILARMQVVAPYTNWVRSYSSSNGLENTPSVAHQLGLKIAATAWISTNAAQNTVEINNLIAAANQHLVDVALVGSEAVLRNDVTPAQLIAFINQVRQAIPKGIPVATADSWGTFVAHPELIAAVDQVWANFYPYWEGTAIGNSMCSVISEYQQLVSVSGSKPVVISEAGWPSGGNAVGAAVPSLANANLYADQFLSWANANNIASFYFEAFNEDWKISSEGPQGATWGIFDEVGAIKPGMNAYFNGQTMIASCGALPPPGSASLVLTYVPPYGSSDALEIQATGVSFANFAVATYIKVAGGWWTEPTFAQPTVALNVDGSARVPIVTGGSDSAATDISAFLVPSTCSPPQAGGGSLPSVACAVASVQVSRTQSSISGTILDAQSNPIAGATISDPNLGSTKSAADGKFSFYNIAASGAAHLTVTDPPYVFPTSPATVSLASGNNVVNFQAAALQTTFVISGRITVSGMGMSSVQVNLNGSLTASMLTDSTGSYNFSVSANGTYRLGASHLGFSFSPPVSLSSITSNQTVNFTGTPATGAQFVPVAPCRLVDTRVASFSPNFGPPSFIAGTTRTFPIPSSTNCSVPANAVAYVVNGTVVTKGYLGFLSIWPAGQPMPNVSTLNSYSTTSTALSNMAIVPAGANGAISVYSTDATDVILDLEGYFAPPQPQSADFYTLTPCRLVDTRVASFGADGPPFLSAGATRAFPITSSASCSVPTSAAAYSLNITAIPKNTLGILTIWPTGSALPNASILNVYSPGTVVANAAIVAAGTNGSINVFATDQTDLVIDINGYFAPPSSSGLQFYPVFPCRVADTRVGSGIDDPFGPGPMTPGVRNFPISSSACELPSGASAYSFNFTAVPTGYLGILSTWPAGQSQPNVSTLNSYNGSVVANAAIVPSGNGGSISVSVTDITNLLFDVNGYFAP